MTVSNPGRYLFGASTLSFGLVTLVWPEYYDWLALPHVWNAVDGRLFAAAASIAQTLGGAAIFFRPTARAGAVVLGAVYLSFAILCIPQIAATPHTYDPWGNLFEQVSLVTGAAIVAGSPSASAHEVLDRVGRILFGVCTISFAIEQAIHLDVTAGLVPKWILPNQMFWAVTTTVLFALAALALLTNRWALPASRLLTTMIASFGLLVWVPLLLSNPRNHSNWSEAVETFAIAGAAWVLAALLAGHRVERSSS